MTAITGAGPRVAGCCLALAWVVTLGSGCRAPEVPRPPVLHAPPAAAEVDRQAAVESDPRHLSIVPTMPDPVVSLPQIARWTTRGISFEGVVFDSRSHRLVVVDQPGGPGSRHGNAAAAAAAVGGIAAVNAGFFTPGGDPVGLVVSGGRVSGAWNGGSSIGSGVWHATPTGGARIVRREALGADAARRMPELIQSGPMLVTSGRAVPGLHGGDPRPRTMIAWDGKDRWWIGVATPCVMPDLAMALQEGAGPGFAVRTAMNLDGGRSSELWVSGNLSGGPVIRRSPWNRAVRNHLVLVGRKRPG